MYSVSSTFLSTIQGSHRSAFRFDVLSGSVVTSFAARATGGSVIEEKGADRRRRLENLTIADPINPESPSSLVPINESDFLNAYGNEIRPYRGVILPDGTTEWCPMGTFRITKLNIKEGGDGLTITVSGVDRAVNVSRNTFLAVYGVPLGILKTTAIRQVLANRYPSINLRDSITVWDNMSPKVTPSSPQLFFNKGTDPWQGVVGNIVGSIACDLFFDRLGLCVLQPDAALSAGITPSVYTLTEGANCQFTDLDRGIDADTGCNVALVTGVGSNVSGIPPTGLYWDNDPASPTYVAAWTQGPLPTDGGYSTTALTMNTVLNGDQQLTAPSSSRYGINVMSFSDPGVQTLSEAVQSAKLRLSLNIGPTETVQLTSWALPFIDVDDILTVTRTKVGATGGNYIVTSVRTPFEPGGKQTISMRRQRKLI